MTRTVIRRVLKGLLVAFVSTVAVAAAWFWRARGTEVCFGCQLEREVVVVVGVRTVQQTAPNPCSEWVAAQAPAHVHSWAKTGCWFAGVTVSCSLVLAPSEDWLAHLKALTTEELAIETASMDARWKFEWAYVGRAAEYRAMVGAAHE